jgi:hypothetical protein
LLTRKNVRDRRASILRHLQLGRKQHPFFSMLFRLQPCLSCRRLPQLALQALGFGTGLGVFQRDQRLSGADSVAVRDQNFPDDTTLEVLNRLAARLGLDGADSNRSALQRGIS